jgi:hypothetical protein
VVRGSAVTGWFTGSIGSSGLSTAAQRGTLIAILVPQPEVRKHRAASEPREIGEAAACPHPIALNSFLSKDWLTQGTERNAPFFVKSTSDEWNRSTRQFVPEAARHKSRAALVMPKLK